MSAPDVEGLRAKIGLYERELVQLAEDTKETWRELSPQGAARQGHDPVVELWRATLLGLARRRLDLLGRLVIADRAYIQALETEVDLLNKSIHEHEAKWEL
jgi:hypothetical protein